MEIAFRVAPLVGVTVHVVVPRYKYDPQYEHVEHTIVFGGTGVEEGTHDMTLEPLPLIKGVHAIGVHDAV